MSNMVPGRPRRQQQAYRRANTSLTLISNPDQVEASDPYISCTNLLDKFNGSAQNISKDTYAMANGSPARKTSGGSHGGAGAIKDFLLGRSSAQRKESTSKDPDLIPQWSVQESVIDELRISTIPRQPKYSYLIGKSAQNDWRKSNLAVSSNNNVSYSSRPSDSNNTSNSSYYLPQHNSSSSKRLNDYSSGNTKNSNHNAQSAAYEDRISTALRKAPSGSSGASSYHSATSSAVQKSKSYSNFDFVRRDLNFQVGSFFFKKTQDDFLVKVKPIYCTYIFQDSLFSLLSQCTVFENHRKSLTQNCKQSELCLDFEWTKVN